jgi:hypothetical protein
MYDTTFVQVMQGLRYAHNNVCYALLCDDISFPQVISQIPSSMIVKSYRKVKIINQRISVSHLSSI